MTDLEFTTAFENCTLSPEHFHHRDHLRLALIYLRRYGREEAAARIAESIRRYAAHLGKSEKYHHTMTIAWLDLLASAARSSPAATLDEILAASPELLNKATLDQYYSPALLQSEAARSGFVTPDLKPLPSEASAAH